MKPRSISPPATASAIALTQGECTVVLRSTDNAVAATVPVRWCRRGDPEGPVRVVLGGISASADVARWWPQQTGSDAPLWGGARSLLGIEWIGERPAGWRCVTPADQANAVAAVLDALGIEQVDAIIGASYGGAVALAFVVAFPQRAARALVLCAAHRATAMAVAQRSLQRQVLRFGLTHGDGESGLALARALAMTTYRSEAEFDLRFDAAPEWRDERWQAPVETYLCARGAEFAGRFDAQRYLVLSESLDLQAIEPQQIQSPLHVLAIREDRLVPVADIAALARQAAGPTRLRCISSVAGHDGFLTETAAVGRWLRHSLASVVQERMRQPA